jgi:hypothetical protein
MSAIFISAPSAAACSSSSSLTATVTSVGSAISIVSEFVVAVVSGARVRAKSLQSSPAAKPFLEKLKQNCFEYPQGITLSLTGTITP